MTKRSRIALVACSLVIMSVVLIGIVHGLRHQGPDEGSLWLNWDQSAKRAFVGGYLEGYREGHTDGCSHYPAPKIEIELNRPAEELPTAKCSELMPKFNQDFDKYVNRITEFYRLYPAERTVGLTILLNKLSDSENLTAEQVHEWFLVHGHVR